MTLDARGADRPVPDGIGPARQRSGSGGDATARSAFVESGREEALDRAAVAIGSARDGRPRVVLVEGEAGAGKSVLAAEIARRARSAFPDLLAARGQCSALVGPGVPFEPFREIVPALVGQPATIGTRPPAGGHADDRLVAALIDHAPELIGPIVSRDAARRAVDGWPRADERDAPARGPTLDRIRSDAPDSAPVGAPATDVPAQAIGFLVRAAGIAPLLVVVEDVHWADAASLGLLFGLARHLAALDDVQDVDEPDCPLTLLVTARYQPAQGGEHGSAFRELVAFLRRCWPDGVIDLAESIGTERGRAFTAALVVRERGTADPDLAGSLFDRTGGHPLFAAEALRISTRERLGSAPSDGATDRESSISDRVAAVVATDLARLPADLLETLEFIAAHPGPVGIDLLARALAREPYRVAWAVRTLARDDRYLRSRSLPGARGPAAWDFRHEVLAGAVRARTGEAVEREIHRRFATALRGDGPTAAGRRGWHHEAAGDHDAAFDDYMVAGDDAYLRLELPAALGWFRRAAALMAGEPDSPRSLRCGRETARCLRLSGEVDSARTLLVDVISRAEAAGEETIARSSQIVLGFLHADTGETEAAVDLLRSVLLGDLRALSPDDLSVACTTLAWACYLRGEFDEAMRFGEQAVALARRAGLPTAEAEGLSMTASCLVDTGRYDAAIALYEQARAISRREGDVRGEAVSDLNLALCHIRLGREPAAHAALDRAHAMAIARGARRTEALSYHFRGLLEFRAGRHADAEAFYRRAHALLDGSELPGRELESLLMAEWSRHATALPATLPAAVESVCRYLEDVGADGMEAGIVYGVCVQFLRAAGQRGRANRLLAAGQALIRERSRRITDDGLRHSYLHDVDENRDLLAIRPG